MKEYTMLLRVKLPKKFGDRIMTSSNISVELSKMLTEPNISRVLVWDREFDEIKGRILIL
jgi:hypothetical protein